MIPKSLQRSLPFKDKPKVAKEVKDQVQSERIAVMREPRERKVRFFANLIIIENVAVLIMLITMIHGMDIICFWDILQ